MVDNSKMEMITNPTTPMVVSLAVALMNWSKYPLISSPIEGTKFLSKTSCNCSLTSPKTGNAEKIAKAIDKSGTKAISEV